MLERKAFLTCIFFTRTTFVSNETDIYFSTKMSRGLKYSSLSFPLSKYLPPLPPTQIHTGMFIGRQHRQQFSALHHAFTFRFPRLLHFIHLHLHPHLLLHLVEKFHNRFLKKKEEKKKNRKQLHK